MDKPASGDDVLKMLEDLLRMISGLAKKQEAMAFDIHDLRQRLESIEKGNGS